MTRKRKMADEKRAEWAEDEHRVWVRFIEKLNAAATMGAAGAIGRDYRERPAAGKPGRLFYTNLLCFLGGIVPAGSTSEERKAYLALVRRAPETDFKPGVRERLEGALEV